MRTALVLVLLAAGLATSTFLLHRGHRALEDRLRELEASRASSTERGARAPGEDGAALSSPGASPALTGREPAATEPTPAEARRIETTVAELVDRMTRQEAEVQEVAKVVVDGSAPTLGRPEFEDAVRGVVSRMLEEETFRAQVAVAAKAGEISKKPHLDVLAKALSLDEAQKRRFREDLQDVQGQLFTILSEPSPDGSTWMEKIAAAQAQPEGDPRRAQMYVELLQAKVPGGQQTFLERAVELATEFRRRAGEYLRSDQSETFARLDVDLFGVKMN